MRSHLLRKQDWVRITRPKIEMLAFQAKGEVILATASTPFSPPKNRSPLRVACFLLKGENEDEKPSLAKARQGSLMRVILGGEHASR